MNSESFSLAKWLFFGVCCILLLTIILEAKKEYRDQKEFEEKIKEAIEQNNPILCENIKNLKLSSQCYALFIEQGFDCRKEVQTNSSSACFIAQGVYLEDDLFCDEVLTGTNVPENLECRVSVFIQRYTNEGLSDCCHIK